MSHRRRLLLLVWIASSVLFLAPRAILAEDPVPGQQRAERLEVQVPVRLNYLLYLPKNYQEQDKWPLLLFLHGAGERGDDIEKVKIHGPPKLIAAGQDFPFIVVSPQCPADGWWEPIELNALLDDVVRRYKVDEDRVYLTGLSMGGFGTWQLAAYAPQRFAAIAPICGRTDPRIAKRVAKLPAWVFHGALDKAVPVSGSEVIVAAIQKAGGDPRLTIYPDLEHDSWTVTYANPELYEWLLQNRRRPAEPDKK